MQLSIYEGEPGYIGTDFGRYQVWLDGVLVERAVRADTTLGIVTVLAEDAEGNLRIDYEAGEAIREQRSGSVTVVDLWADGGGSDLCS